MKLCFVGKRCFFVVNIFLLIHFYGVVHSKPALRAGRETSTNATKDGSNTETEAHSEGHKIKVAKFDFQNIATPFIVTVWVLLASLLKVVFHMTKRLSKVVPESCMVILLGVLLGFILHSANFKSVATIPFFNSRIFFLFLLPPIVLDAGYFLHIRAFFDNFGTILLYAVVGTIFNTFTVGLTLYVVSDLEINLLQMLLFSCLIAAVDPVAVLAVFEEVHVNEVLYILVFGESLLNDAVTVVLYRLFEALVSQVTVEVQEVFIGVAAFFVVSLGGVIIGIFWAYLTAFLSKFTDHVRVLEPIFVVCMCYMSYLTAELFHFSGIISIVTCAIVMKPYVEANISQKSRIPMKYFMKMASTLSETIIFMMLGVVLFERDLEFNAKFVFLTIFLILVFRCLGVVLLTWLANSLRLNKLGKVDQFIMAYGGLRGAVSFSLATVLDEKYVDEKQVLETTTIAVVFFTVFVQGITIKPLVNLLHVKRAVKRKEVMLGEVNDKMLDHLLGGIQDVIQHRGRYYWKNLFAYVDLKYLRPWFMRNASDKQAIDETVLMVYRKISSREAEPPDLKREHSESNEDPGEFEHVVKDRRRSSALAPPVESERFKDMVQHAQLAVILGKPRKGTIHRFSKNNILDETDICDEALRLRRRSQTAHVPRHVMSRKISQQVSGDESEKNTPGPTHHHHHRGHKPHDKHRKKHGHRHRHHGKHEKVKKQLSDIRESPTSGSSPGTEIPSGNYTPTGSDAEDHPTVRTDVTEGDMTSDSDNETQDLLPKLADLEPSSPQLASNYGVLSNEPTVSTQNGPAADDEGVSETVM